MNWEFGDDYDKNKPKHKCRKEECNCYDKDIVRYIEAIYAIGVILWFVLVFLLQILEPDIIVWIFLFLPPAVFLINILNVCVCSKELEDQMFRGNFVAFGFLIAIILINWKTPIEKHDKSKFFLLLVVAFILIMVSLVDIWVEEKYQSIIKHIKTILNTSAAALLALALYLYYKFYQKSYQYLD